jgi:AcrR family transcriptional regulator
MSKKQPTNRRFEILQAAQKLMSTKGLSGVTTRQLAREVGCSEGALYVHFKGRLQLLLAMLEENLPDVQEPLYALERTVGQNSPEDNLVTAISGIYKFNRHVAPLFGGLFAEPKLLEAYRKSLAEHDRGPHLAIARLQSYIEAEQKLGRIGKSADAKLIASLLLSACFFRAFVEHFLDKPMQPAWDKFAIQLVSSLVPVSE